MTAPTPRPDPDVAERLAEAVPFTTVMRFHGPAEVPSRAEREHIAAALLPVVDAIAAERAAEELRALACEALEATPGAQRVHIAVSDLFDRASALRGEGRG